MSTGVLTPGKRSPAKPPSGQAPNAVKSPASVGESTAPALHVLSKSASSPAVPAAAPPSPPLHSAVEGASAAQPAGHVSVGTAIAELLRSGSNSNIDEMPEPPTVSRFGEKPSDQKDKDTQEGKASAASAGADGAPAAAAAAGGAAAAAAAGGAAAAADAPGVAFFDLDLTLLDINTGRSWVEKEFREGKVPFQIYLLAVYWFAKYAAGMGIDASEVACEAMALYGGQSSSQMAIEVDAWWEDECAHRLRPKAAAVMAAHRAKGERCVLCTASWQHVAACAQKSYGLDDVISSVIEVSPEGTFSGKVTDAYGDNKWVRTKAWADAQGVDLRKCSFYTDSFSDRKLMEAVGVPVAVCPDSRLLAHAGSKGWAVEDWGEAPPHEREKRANRYCSVFGMKISG